MSTTAEQSARTPHWSSNISASFRSTKPSKLAARLNARPTSTQLSNSPTASKGAQFTFKLRAFALPTETSMSISARQSVKIHRLFPYILANSRSTRPNKHDAPPSARRTIMQLSYWPNATASARFISKPKAPAPRMVIFIRMSVGRSARIRR